jgi:hypothetical protein
MIDRIAWLILAAVHTMPALAFFRPAMLTTLYQLQPDNPLFLLMRHRAALFVAIFVICLWAMIDPASRRVASVAVAISMLSFLWLYWQAGSPAPLKQIALVDLAGLPFLLYLGWRAFTS